MDVLPLSTTVSRIVFVVFAHRRFRFRYSDVDTTVVDGSARNGCRIFDLFDKTCYDFKSFL